MTLNKIIQQQNTNIQHIGNSKVTDVKDAI